MELGQSIKNYINEKGISQTYLSKRTGISLPKINMALTGKRRFSCDEYALICGALDVDTNYFLKPKKFNDG